jgi:hypothetical protein
MNGSDKGQERRGADLRPQRGADPVAEARSLLAVIEATVLAGRTKSTAAEHHARFSESIKGLFADG